MRLIHLLEKRLTWSGSAHGKNSIQGFAVQPTALVKEASCLESHRVRPRCDCCSNKKLLETSALLVVTSALLVTSRSKKLLETSALLVVTSALLVEARSY